VFKPKRAVPLAEHEAIVARETNHERRAFYQLAWQLAWRRPNLAMLTAEDVDWEQKVISFLRRKTRAWRGCISARAVADDPAGPAVRRPAVSVSGNRAMRRPGDGV